MRAIYKTRRDALVESFGKAGIEIPVPQASMFAWVPIPEKFRHLGSLEFSKLLIEKAEVAVAPGIGEFIEAWARLLPESSAGVRALTSVDELLYTEPELLTCPAWWVPGAVVVGDAAHFFGPETGASAGVGLADALALAEAVRANPKDADAACATYEQWRGPAIRPVEAMDPSRRRLEGTAIPEPAPDERWPPAA
jgi:2-polyprenyl-6-methoxyphenol hydroxylase-like FAD-dependent oxidoreductase